MKKRIITFIKKILEIEIQGFYYLFLIISRGLFLIVDIPFILLSKITKSKKMNMLSTKVSRLQETPMITLIGAIIFSTFVLYKMYLYVPNEKTVKIDDNILTNINNIDEPTKDEKSKEKEEDYNLYRKFSSYKISDINFSKLKEVNNDVVSWIIVDGTNINYPIVQTSNNDFYLEHDINKMSTMNGWTFVDYRNDSNMQDDNTIFYGHNLFNKTAFGSLSNLFTDNWFNTSNHKIIVLTESNKYTYEVFSIYYSEPDSSYLSINYDDKEQYENFLNNINSKSLKPFSINLTESDKIITLSTCTDDNNGRKVIHAKLIKTE